LKISAIGGYELDILLLSDTRLNGRDRVVSEKLSLHYKMHHNSRKKSRGVAVLFSNRLSVELLERAADVDKNILLLKVKINGNTLIVGSVYGPNSDISCEPFFEFIRQTCNRWQGHPIILGGDWNATPSLDDIAHNLDVISCAIYQAGTAPRG
jgi:exonuclease III